MPDRNKMTIRLILSAVLVVGAAAYAAAPSRAQTTIAVSPAQINADAQPGETGETSITVGNQGEEPFAISASIEPYSDESESSTAVSWLTVAPSEQTVAPGESATFSVQINVPEDANTGGRYARIAFETSAADGSDFETGFLVAPRVAATVAIVVNGEEPITREAILKRFAPVIEFDGRVGFRADVQNDGNVHINPSGNVDVKSPSGDILATAELPEPGRILPGLIETLASSSSLPLSPGDSYAASLELEGEMDEPLTAEVEFTNEIAIKVGELSICENLDRGPTVGLQVVNSGNIGVAPQLELSVTTAAGAVSSATSPPGSLLVWPESTEEIGGDLADRLPTGDYTLRASLQAGPGDPIVAELPFSIGGLGENAAPICEGSGL